MKELKKKSENDITVENASYALGIDTGGTFTDGVVYNLTQNKIIAKTKVITTRSNLTIAINNCLDNLLFDLDNKKIKEAVLNRIKMVCLSTTLATNAIVEGQGADVGLILIGYEPNKTLPAQSYVCIKGGCDIKGKIKEPVEPAEAKAAIHALKGKVEAFAVSGYMSIRNPAQELEVEKLIMELTGCPIVCAHQLSADLGIYERTVTAILNARLIPLIAHLIDAVKAGLAAKKIRTVVKVVRGDGSLISEKVAREKPVETILSGPAASFIGARTLSGIQNAIVVDMGGTTTDVAVLKNGKPSLNDEGARVGGWLTRVKAAEITTVGLGGDSFIQVSKDKVLTIGPQKVFPLSWITTEYPYLLGELDTIKNTHYFPLNSQPTCIMCLIKEPANIELNETERNILKIIKDGPHSLYYISKKLNKDANIIPWERLVNIGAIHRANLTPTDILHVTGKFSTWNKEAAALGVSIMSDRFGSTREIFVKKVLDKLHYMIFELLIEKLIARRNNKISIKKSDESVYLIKEMFYREDNLHSNIMFSVSLNLPVVAVGAPVIAYFPEVVKKLNTRLIIPPDADVANAVGTVNGQVVERVKVLIKPGESAGFYVYNSYERKMFMELDKAVEYGVETGKGFALRKAAEAGAFGIEIFVERNDRYISLSEQPGVALKDKTDKLFIESIIDISAVGNPWEGEHGR
ncbi:MAG: hydantoinase/oxoprolinase family protein [Spirochaetota bacterium]